MCVGGGGGGSLSLTFLKKFFNVIHCTLICLTASAPSTERKCSARANTADIPNVTSVFIRWPCSVIKHIEMDQEWLI